MKPVFAFAIVAACAVLAIAPEILAATETPPVSELTPDLAKWADHTATAAICRDRTNDFFLAVSAVITADQAAAIDAILTPPLTEEQKAAQRCELEKQRAAMDAAIKKLGK